MELRLYDSGLNFCGAIDSCESFILVDKYFSPGTMELHAPITESILRYTRRGNLIRIPGRDSAAVIEQRTMEETRNKAKLVVKGRLLASYLDRRLIKGTVNFSGKTEVGMRQLVSDATPIPLLELGNLQEYVGTVCFQATYKNLLTYEEKLAKSAGLGFRIRPDFRAKKLVFEVYKGVDRSASQSEHPRVVFSEKFTNLERATYSENDQLYKNVAYVGGGGEGSERVIVTVGEAEGLDLREMFVDARDLQQGELTGEEYAAALQQRGLEKMSGAVLSEAFECEVSNGNYRYGRDYYLGDIVSVRKKSWGITTDCRITEVREVWENGIYTVEPTFGDPVPETIDWSDT